MMNKERKYIKPAEQIDCMHLDFRSNIHPNIPYGKCYYYCKTKKRITDIPNCKRCIAKRKIKTKEMEDAKIVSEKVLINRDELLSMFRNGINMYNYKSNLSQISNNVYSCKEYIVKQGFWDEELDIAPVEGAKDYRCSVCKRYTLGFHKPEFCSHCGAEMSDKNETT